MIASARKCGCPLHAEPQGSSFPSSSCSDSIPSCSSLLSAITSHDDGACGCGSESTIEDKKPKIVSEIAAKGLPYKEIETIFNNNRVILRLQKEKSREKFDPPCDCVEPLANESRQSVNLTGSRSDVVFQKASKGCRTIEVYPNPDPKEPTPKIELPSVNPEENPNIFVLKIKRKSDKSKLDLEFKSPRPWRKPKC